MQVILRSCGLFSIILAMSLAKITSEGFNFSSGREVGIKFKINCQFESRFVDINGNGISPRVSLWVMNLPATPKSFTFKTHSRKPQAALWVQLQHSPKFADLTSIFTTLPSSRYRVLAVKPSLSFSHHELKKSDLLHLIKPKSLHKQQHQQQPADTVLSKARRVDPPPQAPSSLWPTCESHDKAVQPPPTPPPSPCF